MRTRTTRDPRPIAGVTFYDLNRMLLETEDVAQLQRWLDEAVAEGVLYRALRVHGRLNGVRRQQELKAIKAACDAAQRRKEKAA